MTFLHNWKHSKQFFGTMNKLFKLTQDFHAYSNSRSTQSVQAEFDLSRGLSYAKLDVKEEKILLIYPIFLRVPQLNCFFGGFHLYLFPLDFPFNYILN